MANELILKGLAYEEGKRLKVFYKEYEVGVYIPDFIVEQKIIIEIKAVPEIPSVFEKQLFYYLLKEVSTDWAIWSISGAMN